MDDGVEISKIRIVPIKKEISTSFYVMSDIHGCYEDMMKMLIQINFSESDTLIFVGDYFDRDQNSLEMLKLIAAHPDNKILLCGYYDLEFAYNVELMESFVRKQDVDMRSIEDTRLIYVLIQQLSIQKGNGASAGQPVAARVLLEMSPVRRPTIRLYLI